MISCVMPRCDGGLCGRLTLLELVDSEGGLELLRDRLRFSCCALKLALCASSNRSAYLEPRRYVGMKKAGFDASVFAFSLWPFRMPPMLAPAVESVSIALSLLPVELPLFSPSASRPPLVPSPVFQESRGKGCDVPDAVEVLGSCEDVRWDWSGYGGVAEFPPTPASTEE
jgi:hypothetical protein